MSSSTTVTLTLPVTSGPPPLITSGAPAPALSGPPPSAVLSPAEMTAAIRDLTQAVAGIRAFLAIPYAPPPPATTVTATSIAASHQSLSTGQGVPITQIRFPPSPSPLPAWLAAPVYTTATGQPTVMHPSAPPSTSAFGGFAGYADPFTSGEGHLFQGGSLMPTYSAPLRHRSITRVLTPPRLPASSRRASPSWSSPSTTARSTP